MKLAHFHGPYSSAFLMESTERRWKLLNTVEPRNEDTFYLSRLRYDSSLKLKQDLF
jgi:hypothetical protein